MKYSNIILFSDLDGTLLNSQSIVSDENRKAIEHFVANGGRFGVATGRSMKNAMGFIEGVPLNYYSIFLNGATLHDMKEMKNVETVFLDKEKVKPLAETVLEKYPNAGIQVYMENDAYFISSKELTPDRVVQDHCEYDFTTLEAISDKDWTKLFFYGEPEELKVIEEESKSFVEDGIVDGIYTHINYYELLPKDCNKGLMIKKIHSLKGKQDIVYAVGDYYNDIEMIDEANVGIYTENAPEELKKRVEIISVDCNENVIADVIYRIIDGSL
jgi:Cof subfamily protein (haloacid dehalogenase superfamily)